MQTLFTDRQKLKVHLTYISSPPFLFVLQSLLKLNLHFYSALIIQGLLGNRTLFELMMSLKPW